MHHIFGILTKRFLLMLALALLATTAAGIMLRPGLSGGANESSLEPEHPESEPADMQPAATGLPFKSGMTLTGETWTALRYPTKGGFTCVDIAIEGAASSAGGCFDPADGTLQWGATGRPDSAEQLVFGYVVDGKVGDKVKLLFTSGDVVEVAVEEGGVFAGAGRGSIAQPPSKLLSG